jgi:hypothetical protein
MQKSIETVQNNFNTIRTGRANPLILDKVQVRETNTCCTTVLDPQRQSCWGRATLCQLRIIVHSTLFCVW